MRVRQGRNGGTPNRGPVPFPVASGTTPPVSPYLPIAFAGGDVGVRTSPIVGAASPAFVPFDFILVLDFEATCEDPEPDGYDPEIIEFPVVLIDVSQGRIVGEFHSFVKPARKKVLSTFCMDLTGISQADIESAPRLPVVIGMFDRWMKHHIPRGARTIFATDGPWDLCRFMHQHAVCRQGVTFPSIFYSFIDVKEAFSRAFKCGKCKIEGMLSTLALKFEGRPHSGMDDARNVARIVLALLAMQCDLSVGMSNAETTIADPWDTRRSPLTKEAAPP